MTDHSARTFSSDFKRFFLRGLVILLPSVLTLWIVVKAYQFVDTAIAEPINRSVRVMLHQASPHWAPLRSEFDPSESQINAALADRAVQRRLVDRERARRELTLQIRRDSNDPSLMPSEEELNAYIATLPATSSINTQAIRSELRQRAINQWWNARWYMNFIGLIIAVIAVYIAGRLLGGFFGRRIYRKIESVITSVPVFKQVYPHVKQIVDFLFNDEQPIKFNRVVVVQYPRKGIWSIGFLTGPSMKSIVDHAGEALTVFVPSSPTPFTGYTITVPKDDVMELSLSVDEAVRFLVSGGVLIPDHQHTDKPQYSINGNQMLADDMQNQMSDAAVGDGRSESESQPDAQRD